MQEGLSTFDRVTAVRRVGSGVYEAELVPSITIDGTRPNGGFLLAMLGRAAVDTNLVSGADQAHPVSATAQYLSAPELGPARLEVEVLRRGRTASQVSARLSQNDKFCVSSLFVLGHLRPHMEPFWTRESPFDLAAAEDTASRWYDGERPPSMHLVQAVSYDPRSTAEGTARPELPAELRAWVSHADGRDPDVYSLLQAADGLPPAAWGLGLSGWIPTLALTVYVRALPSPGALQVRQMARLVQDGLLDESCEVWDSAGRLVAQATQLAAARLPEVGPALE
jgi:hypothetical protein